MKTEKSWSKKRKPLQEEQQEWLINFLGYYAEYQLYATYYPEKRHSFPTVFYICSDKRRLPTVRRYLETMNLIERGWSKEIAPVDEEILKIIPGFSEEPTFDTKGTNLKEGRYSYSNDEEFPVETVHDKYLEINNFTPKQMIHVFIYQDQYSFKILSRKMYNSHASMLCVYPKALLNTADQNVIRIRAFEYAKEHLNVILSHAYKIRIKVIHDLDISINSSNHPEALLIPNRISEILEKVRWNMRLLHRAQLELKVLKRIIEREGVDRFPELLTNFAVEYLTEQAPLWLDSGNVIERDLARIMLRGSTVEELV